jgi:hypothetical protein
MGQDITMKYIPTPIDINDGIHKMIRRKINLSSTEPIKGEKESVTMGFGSIQEKDI